MKKFLRRILSLSLIVAIMIGFSGCALKKLPGKATPKKDIVVKSADEKFQISVPSDWKEDPDLNEIASVQASKRADEKYAIVISESSVDFGADINLEAFAKLSQSNVLGAAKNSSSTDFTDVTINGLEGKAFEITGEISSLKVHYYIVAIKGKDHFHQIITWTLESKYADFNSELKEVAQSFTEN
jgi:hypothetical protein